MSLISTTNLLSFTDKLAAIYDRWGDLKYGIGGSAGVAGTDHQVAANLLALITTTVADYQQQADLGQSTYNLSVNADRAEIAKAVLAPVLTALTGHISRRGSSVASSISTLATMLSYYNGGSGGNAYSSMLHPVFGDLWYDVHGVRLPSAGLFHPGIHPTLNSTYTNGMGLRAVGGSFTAGTAYNSTPLYAELTPLLEVTVDFANGAAHPVVSVAGTDHTGATTTTWDVTFGANDPTAAVSTTITPAVTAMGRQTVAIADATGIIAGSVLTVNSGLPDQEVIVVDSISSTNLVAVFRLAHTSSATLTGKTTVALTPSVSGRRIRSVSGITITISSHDAGTVRVVGKQDRGWKPD